MNNPITRLSQTSACHSSIFGYRVVAPETSNDGDLTGPEVKIYDMRFPMHGEEGQFITSYYVETLMDLWDQGRGLNLYGGEPAWRMNFLELREMLRQIAIFTTPEGVRLTMRDLEEKFSAKGALVDDHRDWRCEVRFNSWIRNKVLSGDLIRGWVK